MADRGWDSGEPSRRPSALEKRVQVSTACQYCRRKKSKCDAQRPCATCASRNLVCQYETEQGETVSQASKRKREETIGRLETHEELFRLIGTRSEEEVAQIVRRIRAGERAGAIVRAVTTGEDDFTQAKPQDPATRTFLITLAHSTGSIGEAVRLALSTSILDGGVPVPDLRDYEGIRHGIVRLSYVEGLLRTSQRAERTLSPLMLDQAAERPSNGSQAALTTTVQGQRDHIGIIDSPPHQVPAAPWTRLTTDDDAVSHLISLFLAWTNPTWRFVEADLFLSGMRSKRIQSEFCSPFLVNSILALACLHSEHEIAFSHPNRDRITRGQHFHAEALRLWGLEDSRQTTITNTQALCVLSLESNYRAQDTLGFKLISTAAQLESKLPFRLDDQRSASLAISPRVYQKVRLSVHWMVRCMHILMRTTLLRSASISPSPFELPKIHEVFDDIAEVWTGYPMTRTATAHRPTVYLRERCRLAELFQEMQGLTLTSSKRQSSPTRHFTNSVEDFASKLQHWYQRLPFDLQYRWPMSIAVWELHALYLSIEMIMYSLARTRLLQQKDSPTARKSRLECDEDARLRRLEAQDYLVCAIQVAIRAAQILRDFRERFGYKIVPAWLLQLQAVAADVLLFDPSLTTNPTDDTSPKGTDLDDELIGSSRAALDEVFRSLLGTSVEVMIARAIARMKYHTAIEQKVILSDSVRSMLRIMSNTAWRSSDMSSVSSMLPNFARTRGTSDDKERLTALLTKWEGLGT